MMTDNLKQNRSQNSKRIGKNSIEELIITLINSNLPVLEQSTGNKLFLSITDKFNKDLTSSEKKQLSLIQSLSKSICDLKINQARKEGNLKAELKRIKEDFNLKKNKKSVTIIAKKGNLTKDLGIQHRQFEKLLSYVMTRENIYLVGSAGSGKTTACQNIAKALSIPFYFTGAISTEYKLTGFINAQGTIVSTEFRKAYENGGLFLFDEIDGSSPQAILAFNAALSNDFMDFPDKKVQRHNDFYCIAAANTFGSGADRQYVGRNQLDAASLDRFIFFEWEVDEDLEREIANNDSWVHYVQRVRKSVAKLKLRILISPRASFKGAKLLEARINQNEVERNVLWNGLDMATIQLIKNNIKDE